MTTEATGEAARGVSTLFQGITAGLPDAELLRRFADRDESASSAFEVLVDRHGPAVWSVCRRTLTDPADALDAFQATFLVLVRKAGTIKVEQSVGPWLHGVSLKVARRARSNALRRKARERTNAGPLDQAMTEDPPVDDLRALLELELARLPHRYRSPLTLCYLEGLTHEEAAARLFCPVGTVRSRLARGRALLHDRLVRRGIAPSIVASTLALDAAPASAALPRSLIASTLTMALARSTTGTAARLVAEVGRSAVATNVGRSVAVTAVFLACAGAIAMVGRNRENNDAPLPPVTAAQIADRIEEISEAHANGLIELEYEEEKTDDLFPFPDFPGLPGLLAEKKPNVAFKPTYHKVPGRSRYVSDGTRWKASLDTYSTLVGPSPNGKYPPTGWTTGFDGMIHYRTEQEFSTVYLGDGQPEASGLAANSTFWGGGDAKSTLDEVLVEKAEVSQKTVDGYRCYVVRLASAWPEQGSEVVISPRQSYLPLSIVKTNKGQAEITARLLDLKQLPDGRWFPGRTVVERRSWTSDAGKFVLRSRRETRVVKFDPDHVSVPADFAVPIVSNARVMDFRTGLFYRNDPWWPEIRDYLRRELDWPRADLSPMTGLSSSTLDLEGRPAPPLAADRWLRGSPVSWETLRGKVVLVVFSDQRQPNLIPALRRVRQAYGKDGFEIVEVVPRYVDPDWTARHLEEYDVDHPVLYDADNKSESGATWTAFAARQRLPRPVGDGRDQVADSPGFLIDPQGKIRTFVEGDWSKVLLDLLHESGAKMARSPEPPENLGIGLRYYRLQTAWRGWTKAAPATGRLVGKLVDDQGKPVAGAKLRARLNASILGGWNLRQGLTTGDYAEATTGEDGSYVVAGLCKGNYAIEVIAPGRSIITRFAILNDPAGEIDPKLVLTKTDAITGIVRDDAGKPIAGAKAELFDHQIVGEFHTSTFPLMIKKTVTTDPDGRFHFDKLDEGQYTLTVAVPGRAGENRYDVPVGATDLKIKLKPE